MLEDDPLFNLESPRPRRGKFASTFAFILVYDIVLNIYRTQYAHQTAWPRVLEGTAVVAAAARQAPSLHVILKPCTSRAWSFSPLVSLAVSLSSWLFSTASMKGEINISMQRGGGGRVRFGNSWILRYVYRAARPLHEPHLEGRCIHTCFSNTNIGPRAPRF